MALSVQSYISERKQRLFYIDNLRTLACFLVILTHSTMHTDKPETDGFWMFLISFLGTPSPALFIALSGTLLLPVKTGFRNFYSRRFKRLLPPFVIWSVIGICIRSTSVDSAIGLIFHIPFEPVISVYWFVYTIAGLYLFAPYISPWVKQASRRQIELFIALWLMTLSFTWILYFCPDVIHVFSIRGNYYWTFVYFGGFMGYWLLGYYLHTYPISIGLNSRWIVLMTLFMLYPLSILVLKLKGNDVGGLLDNLQLGNAVFVAMLYTLVQNITLNSNLQRVVTSVAKYSYGIYLMHIYIARDMLWILFDGSEINIFPRTFLIAIITLCIGYILSWLLSRLPYGKYVSGE